jgi:hypothetical protein
MSLKIEIETIKQVLLSDGWHTVERNSFNIGGYDFYEKLPKNSIDSPLCYSSPDDDAGFEFDELVDKSMVTTVGKMSSIIAVRCWE